MTKEKIKDKYSAFIADVSEIMGLGKPVDVLRLCAVTDSFFRPLNKRIEELEMTVGTLRTFSNEQTASIERLTKENEKLDLQIDTMLEDCKRCAYRKTSEQLEQAKELLELFVQWNYGCCKEPDYKNLVKQAEQFLKGKNIILEDAQAGNSPFDADEVFNKEMKAYPEEKVK